ncbi:uncharacterized protein LOC111049439 [Nilaparvata lugens]|uniref:uncharacterized protein LOC111049439 n=1 Tax=Nilaparvata lugens TaxID=108931 RepID=UPI00193DDB55|nr:uncharacterized protein LOC111049439 [Nilaparvata lugens]
MIEAHSSKEQNSEDFKKRLAEYQKEVVQFSKETDKFEEKVMLHEMLKESIDKKEAQLKEATECLSQNLQENKILKDEIAELREKLDQYVADMKVDLGKDEKIIELTKLVIQYRNEISQLETQRS